MDHKSAHNIVETELLNFSQSYDAIVLNPSQPSRFPADPEIRIKSLSHEANDAESETTKSGEQSIISHVQSSENPKIRTFTIPGTILQEILETLFGSTLPIVLVDSMVFLFSSWLMEHPSKPHSAPQHPSSITALLSTLLFLSKGFSKSVKYFVEDSLILDLLRLLLRLFPTSTDRPPSSSTPPTTSPSKLIAELVFVFALNFSTSDHLPSNTTPYYNHYLTLFDSQRAYVPSPLFSDVHLSSEQSSKCRRFCESLEHELDTIFVALRHPSTDQTRKQELARVGLPLFLSLGLLSPSPSPKVVSLLEELVLPFLSTFRATVSFFNSSLALISPNMQSLVFPALHSLSRLHHASHSPVWENCCLTPMLGVVHGVLVTPSETLTQMDFLLFWSELQTALSSFTSSIEQDPSLRVSSSLSESAEERVVEGGLRVISDLGLFLFMLALDGDKKSNLSNLLHNPSIGSEFILLANRLLSSLRTFFEFDQSVRTSRPPANSSSESEEQTPSPSILRLDWDRLFSTNVHLSEPGKMIARIVFGSLLQTIFWFIHIYSSELNDLIQSLLLTLSSFIQHPIAILVPTFGPEHEPGRLGPKIRHFLLSPWLETGWSGDGSEKRKGLSFPLSLSVEMSTTAILSILINKTYRQSAEPTILDSVLPLLISQLDTTLTSPLTLSFGGVATTPLSVDLFVERGTAIIVERLLSSSMDVRWQMWLRKKGGVRLCDAGIVGFHSLVIHLHTQHHKTQLAESLDWIVVLGEVVDDLVCGKEVGERELNAIAKSKFPFQISPLFPITPVHRSQPQPLCLKSLCSFLRKLDDFCKAYAQTCHSLFTEEVLSSLSHILCSLFDKFDEEWRTIELIPLSVGTAMRLAIGGANSEEKKKLTRRIVSTGLFEILVRYIKKIRSSHKSTENQHYGFNTSSNWTRELIGVVEECGWMEEDDERVRAGLLVVREVEKNRRGGLRMEGQVLLPSLSNVHKLGSDLHISNNHLLRNEDLSIQGISVPPITGQFEETLTLFDVVNSSLSLDNVEIFINSDFSIAKLLESSRIKIQCSTLDFGREFTPFVADGGSVTLVDIVLKGRAQIPELMDSSTPDTHLIMSKCVAQDVIVGLSPIFGPSSYSVEVSFSVFANIDHAVPLLYSPSPPALQTFSIPSFETYSTILAASTMVNVTDDIYQTAR
ncbi:hypothetical protein BLNAU_9709 [Blattamonas nauphoetae]|uniref:Uncharacterized protein n=1 Tax=Blattamonas nauphoetae TaxID=2049346 RepID=A0ABQ9XV08_9EUKA|nr:hypothetical protein BLNAU_9709 [Blattamonas nauphoetae]